MIIMRMGARCIFQDRQLFLFAIVYIILSFDGVIIANAEIGDTLIDGEMKELSSGGSYDLKEGYRLTITIAGNDAVFLLLKNGSNLKNEKVKIGDSFSYFKKINSENYKLISIPSFTVINNKVQFRIYQYSEGIRPEVIKKVKSETAISSTPNTSSKRLLIQRVLEKAKEYMIFFDREPDFMYSVNLDNDTFYIVSYNNPIPYAGGINVMFSNGTKISSESTAEQIFTSIAWKEAILRLNASDRITLNNIINTSKNFEETKSAVRSNPRSPTGLIFGELNKWKNFSISTVMDITEAMPSVEQIMNDSDAGSRFQEKVSQRVSDFEEMRSSTIRGNEKRYPDNSISRTEEDEQNDLVNAFLKSTKQRISELTGLWKTRQKAEYFYNVI